MVFYVSLISPIIDIYDTLVNNIVLNIVLKSSDKKFGWLLAEP